MVKSICSVIIAAFIFLFAGIGEQIYLNKTFNDLHENLTIVLEKTENDISTVSDLDEVRNLWFSKKKSLHFFIPHNDIKEIDLWLSEAVAYKELGNKEECISKIQVALCLLEQLPKNYLIRSENIL